MFLKKIRSKGLAHQSYFLSSEGEAAIIDPRRDFQIYLDLAMKQDVCIKYVFETHRNEDYVIGSKGIAKFTNVVILHGGKLNFEYGSSVKENDTFLIGSLKLTVLETPGHTDESISITVKDTSISDNELLVFTGDTLFAGDTGRIDLYGKEEKQRLAEQLFYSIHNKILPLGDEVIICPAHGKGSVCGKNIGDIEYTTIGFEKKTNQQLVKNKQDFITEKIEELHLIPPYFSKMEHVNKKGQDNKSCELFLEPFSINEFKKRMDENYQLLDIRSPISFSSAHIPGSINIWNEGIPLFAGWILDYNKPILLIDENNEHLKTVYRYLFRLGFDNIKGYLQKGFSNWYIHNEKIESIDFWSVSKLNRNLDADSQLIIDVRSLSSRRQNGFIPNSEHIFVGNLQERVSKLPKEKTIVLYCDSGNKTSIGCSILKKKHFTNVVNLLGGFAAWIQADFIIDS